jgi:hypothetical protein
MEKVTPAGVRYRIVPGAYSRLDITRMNLSVLVRWYVALMSGEYLQGNGQLRVQPRTYLETDDEDVLAGQPFRWCCLGVLSDIGVADPGCSFEWETTSDLGGYTIDHGHQDYLQDKVLEWSELDGSIAWNLKDPAIAFIQYEVDGEWGVTQVVSASAANDRLEWTFEEIAGCLLMEIRRRAAEGS